MSQTITEQERIADEVAELERRALKRAEEQYDEAAKFIHARAGRDYLKQKLIDGLYSIQIEEEDEARKQGTDIRKKALEVIPGGKGFKS